MNSQEAFNNFLKTKISPLLKQSRYQRKGLTYFRYIDDNLALINFQKSIQNTPENVRFTMNLGIASARLQSLLSPRSHRKDNAKVLPVILNCHWQARIADITKVAGDKWWAIEDGNVTEEFVMEITNDLSLVVIPLLEKQVTDEALCESWAAKLQAQNVTNSELMYLALLLKANGSKSRYEQTLDEIAKRVNDSRLAFGAKVQLSKFLENNSMSDRRIC